MNLFIVRDFARTDSSEPSVQVWKKEEKKTSCLKKPYGKINYYMLFIFSKGDGRGQHHFSAQHFNRGGVQVHKISPWEIHFSGAGCPWANTYACDFPVGPGLPAPSGPVLVPSLDSVWICFFLFFTSQSTIFQFSQRYFSYIGTVLPVLNKY